MLRQSYLKQNNFYDRMELSVQELLHHRNYIESMVGVRITTRPNFLYLTVSLSSVKLDITRVIIDITQELESVILREAGTIPYIVTPNVTSAVREGVHPNYIPEDERELYWESIKFGDMIPSDKKFPNKFDIVFKIMRRI